MGVGLRPVFSGWAQPAYGPRRGDFAARWRALRGPCGARPGQAGPLGRCGPSVRCNGPWSASANQAVAPDGHRLPGHVLLVRAATGCNPLSSSSPAAFPASPRAPPACCSLSRGRPDPPLAVVGLPARKGQVGRKPATPTRDNSLEDKAPSKLSLAEVTPDPGAGQHGGRPRRRRRADACRC
jgi:hypothetical protein